MERIIKGEPRNTKRKMKGKEKHADLLRKNRKKPSTQKGEKHQNSESYPKMYSQCKNSSGYQQGHTQISVEKGTLVSLRKKEGINRFCSRRSLICRIKFSQSRLIKSKKLPKEEVVG